MDNFPQETIENLENELIASEPENIDEDIQFEEVIDIDDIQKKLNEELVLEQSGGIKPDSDNGSDLISDIEDENQNAVVKKVTLIDSDCKKYVVYIDPENVDYMEHLSINERKDIINKIIKTHNANSIKRQKTEEASHFVRHAIVACLTILITLPFIFTLANKALDVTIQNYATSRQNFTRLYKEQGKIKMQANDTVPEVKY